MHSLEDFIEKTNSATTAEEVFSCFQKILKSYGYDRICYSLITDHPSINLKAGHGIMRNYPESWMKHYTDKGYEKIDPVPQYSFRTSRPFMWDFVENHLSISEIQKKVMLEAKEAKLLDGIGIPIYGVNGELSGIGLASSTGGIDVNQNILLKIRAICQQFHVTYTMLECFDDNRNNIKLTNREKEILLWAAEGKSDTIIADILV